MGSPQTKTPFAKGYGIKNWSQVLRIFLFDALKLKGMTGLPVSFASSMTPI
jgi:hypothetical protein